MDQPAPKKDKRGGARPNTGPKPSQVKLEIGATHYADLQTWCDLRNELGYGRFTAESFLTTVCCDRIDSPSFKRQLERLRAEKRRRDSGEEDIDNVADPDFY